MSAQFSDLLVACELRGPLEQADRAMAQAVKAQIRPARRLPLRPMPRSGQRDQELLTKSGPGEPGEPGVERQRERRA